MPAAAVRWRKHHFREFAPAEMVLRAAAFCDELQQRRSVRQFSGRPVPREVIDSCLAAASSSPSGANLQPWHWAVVSDPQVKRRIRQAAEEKERAFYAGGAAPAWLEALQPLGTGADKPFLEEAPYVIGVFVRRRVQLPGGDWLKCPYAVESVGIATGILVAALHHAGLACLTYTPSPMGFLNDILRRPSEERPFLLLVTGYPADNAQVPDISRKTPSEMTSYF